MPINWELGLVLKNICELGECFSKITGILGIANIWLELIGIAVATHCAHYIETLNLILHMHDCTGILAMNLFAIL